MPRLADVGLAPEFVAELASVSPPVVTVESLFIRDRQEIASQCRVTTEVIQVFTLHVCTLAILSLIQHYCRSLTKHFGQLPVLLLLHLNPLQVS